MAAILITAEGLGLCYGQNIILDGLSFSLAQGEIIGLLGPNGAGKTSCLRLLSGFLAATTGQVRLNGRPLGPHTPELRRAIGYVPEHAPLYEDLTPQEHLKFIAQCHGLSSFDMPALLRRFDLLSVAHQAVGSLSKGFRRRVALAMAFAARPALLLLDEPGDGLDPNQKRGLAAELRDASHAAAILLSTHQVEDAERFCTRLLVLHQGRLRFDGSPADLRAQAGSGQLDESFAILTQAGT